MDMEQPYEGLYGQAKALIKKLAFLKFYDTRQPMYLKIDTPDIGLGSGLLQVRERMTCAYDKTPDNKMLQPIAFACKSLSSAK